MITATRREPATPKADPSHSFIVRRSTVGIIFGFILIAAGGIVVLLNDTRTAAMPGLGTYIAGGGWGLLILSVIYRITQERRSAQPDPGRAATPTTHTQGYWDGMANVLETLLEERQDDPSRP